jgi:hypothetical protein
MSIKTFMISFNMFLVMHLCVYLVEELEISIFPESEVADA